MDDLLVVDDLHGLKHPRVRRRLHSWFVLQAGGLVLLHGSITDTSDYTDAEMGMEGVVCVEDRCCGRLGGQ